MVALAAARALLSDVDEDGAGEEEIAVVGTVTAAEDHPLLLVPVGEAAGETSNCGGCSRESLNSKDTAAALCLLFTHQHDYSLNTKDVPYSTKFSRRIIFAVFADSSRTAKIKLRKNVSKNGRGHQESLICFRKMFQKTNPQNFSALKIWRYTVCRLVWCTIASCSCYPFTVSIP